MVDIIEEKDTNQENRFNVKKEDLLNAFQKIEEEFLFEFNNERTRSAMIRKFTEFVHQLQTEGKLRYSLMRKFVDASTLTMINQGTYQIKVEISDGREVTIDEYCDILTNKEKYEKILEYVINRIQL